jgi:hypothetical protein
MARLKYPALPVVVMKVNIKMAFRAGKAFITVGGDRRECLRWTFLAAQVSI